MHSELNDFADALLDLTVDLVIQVNEVSIGNARMLGELEHTNVGASNIAAATAQLSASVGSLARGLAQAEEGARGAQQSAHQTQEAVDMALQRVDQLSTAVEDAALQVQDLDQASEEIGDIVQSINEIARQTRLLALNASIEAARAGEAGKGFAVVAAEVKDLSQQTSGAIVDIRQRIGGLQGEIARIRQVMVETSAAARAGREAMELVAIRTREADGLIGQTAGRLIEASRTVSEQSFATGEVAENVTRVSQRARRNIEQLHGVIGAVANLDRLTSSQLARLVPLDLPAKIIRVAKADHVLWKKRLADMLAGLSALKPEELSEHTACRLGKWYHSDATLGLRAHPAYIALDGPHREVHVNGINAVRAFNAGRTDEAFQLMGRVEVASVHVLRLLGELEEAAREDWMRASA
jgi:methyl-accepting chemotaxis protein